MTLAEGSRLGPYEVTAPIGAGGMGEVYRARDTKLNRDVALKVLPDAFVNEPERLARFQREAEVLASLNHPNIAHIYGLEDSSDTTAIVLELVEGLTLAERIQQGPIPIDEALDIARQIIDALEAAHVLGIIHRDLKPANIKITPDGVVKVLDFGLAKALATEDGVDVESSLSPTLTKGTAMGVILGTAAYMSPEQAKGKPVDTRTDVWAFGAVLYEMLAGERAFQGEDVSDTLVSVLRDEPDWSKLPSGVAPSVTQAMRVCLEKNAKQRVRDISAVRLAMAGAFAAPAADELGGGAPASRILPWVVGTILVAGLFAFASWNLKPAPPKEVVRFVHYLEGHSLSVNLTGGALFDLSADGRRLVYAADDGLYVRRLDDLSTFPIPGEATAYQPFLSPDGEWVGYWSNGGFLKIPLGGGAPTRLVSDTGFPRGAHWYEDGAILLASERDGLASASANGGAPTPLTGGHGRPTFPQMLPDRESVLMAIESDSWEIAVQSLATGQLTVLFPGARAQYVPTGHIVFVRQGTLFGVGFDLENLKTTGAPVALVDGFDVGSSPQFDVSESGTLAFISGGLANEARVLGLVGLDGVVERLDVPPAQYRSPRVSPDGLRVVVESEANEQSTLWVYDLSGERAIRQFTLEGNSTRAIWTPDGQSITFGSDRAGTMSIYQKRADGRGVATRLTTAEDGVQHFPSSWSPDGKTLIYMVHVGDREQRNWDVWTLDTEDGATETLFDLTDGVHLSPELSPDGRWITYGSGAQAGDQDVFIEPFPPTGARQRISQNGAYWPTWSPAGNQLIYRPVSAQSRQVLNSVDITLEPELGFSNERQLPIKDFVVVGFYRDYDMTPDGEKLVMVFPAESTSAERPGIHVVVNWFSELERLVPTQ